MHYALRSPETPLSDRQEIAARIVQAVRDGKPESLRGDPRVIYVWEQAAPGVYCFCIYCNTGVNIREDGEWRHFWHNHHRGGVKQRLCKQIAQILDMTPIIGHAPRPAED